MNRKSANPTAYPVILLSLRFLRRWNQSGQKYAGDPDIAQCLRSHPTLLAFLCIMTYATLFYNLGGERRTNIQVGVHRTLVNCSGAWLLGFAMIAPTILFKTMFTFNDAPELFGTYTSTMRWLSGYIFFQDLIQLARAVWVACLPALVQLFIPSPLSSSKEMRQNKRQALLAIIQVLLVNQLRAVNVPTLLLFQIIWPALMISVSPSELNLWTLLLAHDSFFALGGTNGISSIDLSNAYNGISGYNPLPVGLLLFVSNWAGPIYFSLRGLIAQVDLNQEAHAPATVDFSKKPQLAGRVRNASKWQPFFEHNARLTYYMAMAVLGVEVACSVLREHLFVWTVFSPKLLYVAAWVGGWHLGVNIFFGALVVALFG